MKLEKLEIQGFKSFYDFQVLEYKEGVTAVVGPNGCGKSNLSDAISWVLGSQSAAQLRGRRMDDVIFSGSRNRKPLGMAQVILTMRSEDEEVERFEGETIEIGRRLFRTGESEYMLNGKSCRLRNIQELIMDTGLGTSVYTVIEQGKIDQILSPGGVDRRSLLEEAAGITRFKAKRHQTDLKLQSTEQNLLRLNDIINEIEKQAGSLARQAGKARRFKRLRGEMNDLQLVVYINNYFKLFSQQEEILRRLSSLQDHEVQTASNLSTNEAEAEEMKLKLMEGEAELNSLKENLFHIELTVNNLRRKGEEDSQRIKEYTSLIKRNQIKVNELRERLEVRKVDIQKEKDSIGSLEEKVSTSESLLESVKHELEAEKSEYEKLEKNWEESSRKHLDILGRLAELQSLIAKTGTELDQERQKKNNNAGEINELEEELSTVNESYLHEKGNFSDLENELKNLNSEISEKSGRVSALNDEIAQKSDQLKNLRDTITGLNAEIETIKNMQWAEPGRYTAGEYLLQLQRKGQSELKGYLLQYMTADEEYRSAVERYLEDTIHHFVLNDLESALKISGLLKEGKKGRAAFIVKDILEKRTPHPTLEIDDKPGVITSLHRVIEGSDIFAHLLTRLVPDAYIVEEISTKSPVLSLIETADVISLRGDILLSQGVFISGEESEEAAKRFDLQDIMKAKSGQLAEARERLGSLESEEYKLNRQTEELEDELNELKIRSNEVNRRRSVLDEKVRRLDEEKSRLNMKLEILRNEAEQIKREEISLEGKYKEYNKERDLIDAEKQHILKDKDSLKESMDVAKKRLEAVGNRCTERQLQLDRLKTEKQNLDSKIFHLNETVSEMERQIEERKQETKDAQKRLDELRVELKSIERERLIKEEDLEHFREEFSTKEIDVKNRQGRLIEKEQYLKTVRRQYDDEMRTINKLNIELTELSVSLKNLEDNCHKELGRSVSEYASLFRAEEISENMETIEEQLFIVKQNIDSIGEVNPTAYDEYLKVKERLEFYRKQEADLKESIETLGKVITKLEKESRSRFSEAFEKIRENFKEIFANLFEGGRAELRLPEGEDILECPILISAQPPGKRLQNISLLSGGEKAMTSIALLFAIFRYKPGPFCLLDEVDATLDEVNSGRFIRMIQDYSDRTQFILVTHNKRTMEIADVLYGVTMEEPGISKIVSVSFVEDAERLKAAK